MASRIKTVYLILIVITVSVYDIQTAAIEALKNVDLVESVNSTEKQSAQDTEQLTDNNNNEHLILNNSKVVIDLYGPLSTSTKSESMDTDENAENGNKLPLVQLIINEANEATTETIPIKLPNTSNDSSESPTETETDQVQNSLIPPATVNASIAQLTNSNGMQKQGQIIIRYENYVNFRFQIKLSLLFSLTYEQFLFLSISIDNNRLCCSMHKYTLIMI